MSKNWGREIGRAAALGMLLLGLGGCGSQQASSNPLAPVVVPAGVTTVCTARYNFEPTLSNPSPLRLWVAQAWATGVLGYSLASGIASCGTHSAALYCNFNGMDPGSYSSDVGLFEILFSQAQNVQGKTVSAEFYFASSKPVPGNLRVYPEFIVSKYDGTSQSNASEGVGAQWSGFPANQWVKETNQFTDPLASQAWGFDLHFIGAPYVTPPYPKAPWSGVVYVDDINW